MAYVQREVVDITTDAGGDGTGYTGVVTGRVLAIRYVADGTNPYANTADFTVTAEASGLPVITVTNETASASYYPRRLRPARPTLPHCTPPSARPSTITFRWRRSA